MCGICGIAGGMPKGVREQVVRKMNEAIRHRGPDESGYYSSEFCSLAMSRLSVIDLKSGRQPIFNARKTRCIFFNGEIYNYRQLKAELEGKGHKFETHSDTEVLIHMYDEYGESMLPRLRGMFAFCILDEASRTLFLARDRFGEKPLFYHFNGRTLTFSSEILSLLKNPEVPRVLNRDVLHYYLTVTWVPEPFTLLKDVFSLQPGHSMTFDSKSLTVDSYFDFDYRPDPAIQTEEDACEFLRPILEQAVVRQTVSDVPLGAFLSGGIDSSTIAACLQKNSSKKIKTFTVKFQDAAFDESHIAREVAARLGTDHHEIVVPNQDFDESLFWMIIDHAGLPFADSSAIPTYLIAKEIRKHVTVALSGDGGDELFGGYDIFQNWLKIRSLQSVPGIVREGVLGASKLLGHTPMFGKSSKLRQMDRAFTVARYPEEEFGVQLSAILNKGELNKLLSDGQRQSKFDYQYANRFPDKSGRWSSLRKSMYFRLMNSLPLNMLVKVDRMTMANSLEVRAPFLDPDLFSASTKLPDNLLIRGGKGKYIIRQLMRPDLPEVVFDHPKTGFSIPLHNYQNEEFKALANELINADSPLFEVFDPGELERLKVAGFDTKEDNARISVFRSSHRLWMMMMLFGWVKRFDVVTD